MSEFRGLFYAEDYQVTFIGGLDWRFVVGLRRDVLGCRPFGPATKAHTRMETAHFGKPAAHFVCGYTTATHEATNMINNYVSTYYVYHYICLCGPLACGILV